MVKIFFFIFVVLIKWLNYVQITIKIIIMVGKSKAIYSKSYNSMIKQLNGKI